MMGLFLFFGFLGIAGRLLGGVFNIFKGLVSNVQQLLYHTRYGTLAHSTRDRVHYENDVFHSCKVTIYYVIFDKIFKKISFSAKFLCKISRILVYFFTFAP